MCMHDVTVKLLNFEQSIEHKSVGKKNCWKENR